MSILDGNEAEMEEVVKYRIVGGAVLLLLAVCILPIVIRLPYRDANVTAATTIERLTPENQYVEYDEPWSAETPVLPSQPVPARDKNQADVVIALPVPTQSPPVHDSSIKPVPTSQSSVDHDSLKTQATTTVKIAPSRPLKLAGKAVPVKKAKPIKADPSTVVKIIRHNSREKVVTAHPVTLASKWVVQLASFSQAKNATALRDRLRRQGYQAHLVVEKKDGRQFERVYVGPVLNRTRADQLALQLHQAVNMTGLVIRYPAKPSKE